MPKQIRRFYVLIGLLSLLVFALSGRLVKVRAQANIPITIATPADVTGNGATQQLSAITCTGRWVQFIAPSSNSAIVRIGDSNTSSSRGLPMAAGSGFMFPPSVNVNFIYTPSIFYYYAANGDKLSVACGN